jgi:hypothetical protein
MTFVNVIVATQKRTNVSTLQLPKHLINVKKCVELNYGYIIFRITAVFKSFFSYMIKINYVSDV